MPRKITIFAKPGSKVNRVELVTHDTLKVWVKAPAVDGRANEAVVDLLSDYFNIPKSKVELIRGASSKQKVFQIP